MRVIKAENIPLTFGGKATFMIQNILPAIIAAHVQNIEIQDIKAALGTFIPSALQTPGRLNLYEFQNFKVLLDYAHNRAGMRALKNLTDGMNASVKVGVIAPIGDRREEDNIEIGKIAAEMFDEIIIRLDKDLRGKSADELLKMVTKGIHLIKPKLKPEVIPSEIEAIEKALKEAQKDALIVVFCDDVTAATKVVVEMKKEEDTR